MLETCNGEVGLLEALVSCYQDTCSHVAKRFSGEGVRVEAGRVATVNEAEDEVIQFLYGLVLSM